MAKGRISLKIKLRVSAASNWQLAIGPAKAGLVFWTEFRATV
jgi:hypothetical protein